MENQPLLVFVAGDGDVNHGLHYRFQHGLEAGRVRKVAEMLDERRVTIFGRRDRLPTENECFFH